VTNLLSWHLTTIFNLLIAVAGGCAAWYWYRSSKVPAPSKLHGIAPIGGLVTVNTNPLLAAAQASGRLNAIAATWSAVAAFLVALSAFCEIFAR
jgi:hypothetical protein